MKVIIKLVLIGVLILIGIYLLLPIPDLKALPPGALLSEEPADTESVYRWAFFSDLSRAEVMQYYSNVFGGPLQIRLNHPPEDAALVIRDQTRSNYLEELSHIWKDSLYINGYVPDKPQERIIRNDKVYLNKITVRYIPSSIAARLTVLLMTMSVGYFLIKEYRHV